MVIGSLAMTCLLLLATYLWWQAKATDQALLEQKFDFSLQALGQHIDARIANMKLIAKTLANDKHIHHWVETGLGADQESLLVDKLGFLVNEYGLTSASFADKDSHKYWNHEGFLRVLQPAVDTWYFAYLASEKTDLISVYHDKNKKRVDLYVNYQQPEGKGLSGIATSFDGVLEMLNSSVIADHGAIYLVDSSGEIQIHTNGGNSPNTKLPERFTQALMDKLLQSGSTPFIQQKNSLLGARYIPSMNWYLVAHIIQE
jgi:methyl-accepting chemotaxis protein